MKIFTYHIWYGCFYNSLYPKSYAGINLDGLTGTLTALNISHFKAMYVNITKSVILILNTISLSEA